MNRAQVLRELERSTFDLLVIGGGITGAGIARDAAMRGLAVALVEKGDFASGTSSKSSKLIHGGLRYLEHAQFRLVFEGTNERALLMRLAPHLVRPLEFLLPSYKHDKPSLFVLDVGLWIYDALSKFSSPRLHRTVKAERLARLEPLLRKDGLEGGLLYYDCTTDDSRLTLENVLDARALGAQVLNYARVVGLITERGRVVGAEVIDALSPGAPLAVRARLVVNATGPWSDQIRRLAREAPILHTSKGVHLVVDAARLPARQAVVMKQRRRVVFCIPWGERTIIGTTDTFYEGRPEEVAADRADVDYLLALANHYFPDARLGAEDVLATWAGLRPLLEPSAQVMAASDVSREHHIFMRPGLLTIAGGKLTTFRLMAADVLERSSEQLPSLPPGTTDSRPLPGGAGLGGYEGVTRVATALASAGVVDAAVAKHLALTYGSRAEGVVARVRRDPALGARLDPELAYIAAEVDAAVEDEAAERLEDVLERRVPLLLRARDQGLSAAVPVAARMARKLGWAPAQVEAELAAYREVVERTRRFR